MLKLRMNSMLLKLAAIFVDYEAESLPPDGRIVEYGYVASRFSKLLPGKVLDIGCTARHNYIPPTLCFAGWEVYGIDLRQWQFSHPNFHLIIEDARYMSAPDETYNCVYAVSTIEHIGLHGYYGNKEFDADGDIKTAREILRVLKPFGRFIITVPYAKKYFSRGGARRYDADRLARLIEGFNLVSKSFYIQERGGKWIPIKQDELTNKEVIALVEVQK